MKHEKLDKAIEEFPDLPVNEMTLGRKESDNKTDLFYSIDEPIRKPVNLQLAKIRSTRRLMREICSDLLNSENSNNDSRAEVMLDALINKAEDGDVRAAELVLKILGELDNSQHIEIDSLPNIKIVIDNNDDGIRNVENLDNIK